MSNITPIIKKATDVQQVIDNIIKHKATSLVVVYLDEDGRIRTTSSNFETLELLGAIYVAAKYIEETSSEQ